MASMVDKYDTPTRSNPNIRGNKREHSKGLSQFESIGELLEAVGHKSITCNQAALNAHQGRTLANNLATATTASRKAEEAGSPEEKAEWLHMAANQLKAAAEGSVATAEVIKLR